jgi:cytochrome c-type biogenesis protein CcmF
MILIGNFLIGAIFVLLVWALAAAGLRLRTGRPGWERSAVRAVYAATAMVVAAGGLLLWALVRNDFRLEYVASYTSTTLPLVYRITAFWAGQAGSLLLWLLLLLVFAAIALARYRRRHPSVVSPFILITAGSALFFNLLLLLFTNPFQRLDVVIAEGRGLNPLLQNVGMIFHPPTLFVGYVGFTIPFAFVMAALIAGKLPADWMRITRRWTVVSWLFLTVGIVLGAQWAYVELGWGGYWAWDPVENASFIPWIAATAFLHTSILQQRHGVFKKWNVFLVALSFLLCIFGTFITRSGFIESVHAFERSTIGYYFLIFMALMLALTAGVIAWRRGLLAPDRPLGSLLSKEGTFVLTNLLLMGFLVVVWTGTILPTLSELAGGKKIAIQAPFFNAAVVPFAIAFLFLMGVCPVVGWYKTSAALFLKNSLVFLAVSLAGFAALAAWFRGHWPAAVLFGLGLGASVAIVTDVLRTAWIRRKLTGENAGAALANLLARNTRRYGAYLVHLGVVVFSMGVVGSAYFSQTFDATVEQGQTFAAGAFKLHYAEFALDEDPEKEILRADLRILNDGRMIGAARAEKHFHRLFEQPMTEVAIHSNFARDLYVIFSPLSMSGKANFKVLINPLVLWIWVGGILITLGAAVALLPPRRGAPLPEPPAEEAA